MERNGEKTIVELDMSRDKARLYAELASFLDEAAQKARTPLSGFRVGAAALGNSGRVYLGANQEFAGLPLNFTVHAEQAAAAAARAHGETRLAALAVSAAPCGYCRQFLTELKAPLDIVLNGDVRQLADYLPRAFVLERGGENLLTRAATAACGDLEALARNAAADSYAPYTGTRSGLALRTASGRVYAGWLLESGAYNPSLTALQTALTLRALDGAADDPVAAAVLAEAGPAPLAPLLPALLAKIAPRAAVRTVPLDGAS